MRRYLFDAVLFDLDGTLVATDRFWIQAACAGARRAFAELAIERAIPTGEQWMRLVGHPLERGFAELFADLAPEARARVLELCREEEHRLLAAGGAALMPGARATLAALRADGVRLGAASNCSAPYLEHMLSTGLLGAWIEAGRCLDSAGVARKADMVADLLASFATRSAVMVGDRAGDRDAAWENGLPHVHCAFGFAGSDEPVEAEGTIEDLGGLLELLGRRRAGIEAALEASGVLRASVAPPFVLGIGGPPAVGKHLFARDAAGLLEEHGFSVALVPLALFTAAGPGTGGPVGGAPELDREALARELLEPYAAGRPAHLSGRLPGRGAGEELRVDPDDLLVLVGRRLVDPSLRPRIDRVLQLQAGEAALLRRAAGRERARSGGLGGPREPGEPREPEEPREIGIAAALAGLRSRDLSADRAHARTYPPEAFADVLVAADDPLAPRILHPPTAGASGGSRPRGSETARHGG